MGIFSFIICSIYTIAGVAAFGVFLMMKYYAAAIFGFATAAISGVTAHINWLHVKNRLELWYDKNDLWQLFWLGFWIFAFSTSGFIYFFTSLLYLQQFRIEYIVAAIWGLITLKSGVGLMYYSKKYGRNEAHALIVNEEPSEA